LYFRKRMGDFMAKRKENIRIILNGNFYTTCDDLKSVLSSTLSIWYPKIQFVSAETIRHWIQETLLMVEELMDVKGEARVKRQITNIKKYLDRELTQPQLVKFYTDIIMAGEGLSTLSGFGIAKTSTTAGKRSGKATAGLNAERISLYEIE